MKKSSKIILSALASAGVLAAAATAWAYPAGRRGTPALQAARCSDRAR
mgnify:CR=1 FL=1